MKVSGRTDVGGAASRFQTTQWSCILSAKTKDATRRRLILGNLIETYWRPVYCYLYRKGFDSETAKDLTQGFFTEIVLGRDLIQKADQAKGRFRSLLLVAVERYVLTGIRYENRFKRGGGVSVVPLQAPESASLGATLDPAQAFCYGWVVALLDAVIAEVRQEYCQTQRLNHWESFRLKVLNPIFGNAKPPSYRSVCEQLVIADETKAANMVITVKRRFRAVLNRRLRDLVGSDAEAEEEFRDIFRILSRQGAE